MSSRTKGIKMTFEKSHTLWHNMWVLLNQKLLEGLYDFYKGVVGVLGSQNRRKHTIGHLKLLAILGYYDSVNYVWYICPLVVVVPMNFENCVPAISF